MVKQSGMINEVISDCFLHFCEIDFRFSPFCYCFFTGYFVEYKRIMSKLLRQRA